MTAAYIGLGSNLDDPRLHVSGAFVDLASIPATELLAKSSMYRSPPQGPRDQPDFINAVVKLETTLPANILLEYLQEIEQRHGRRRIRRWGPRTLDLDILLYGDRIINDESLTVPHPELSSRGFVLYPLLEIDKGIEVPGLGRIDDLLSRLAVGPPERI